MKPNQTIEATTSQGSIAISYIDKYTRRYKWDEYDKTFQHQPRYQRWYGSLGMYRPQGDNTMHAVLEEAQQNFSTKKDAIKWLAKQEKFMDCVWTKSGLVVGWKQQKRPNDDYLALSVDVWQILIDGDKPNLPNASPLNIRLTTSQ